MPTVTIVTTYHTSIESRNPRLNNIGPRMRGNFDCVILSPLKSAIQTYVESDIKCKDIKMEHVFREHQNGILCNYLENEPVVIESTNVLHTRVRSALYKLYREYDKYRSILIISHPIFVSTFLKILNRHVLTNGNYITFDI